MPTSHLDSFIEGIGSYKGSFDCGSYVNRTDQYRLAYCMVGDEIIYYNEQAADYWRIPVPTSVNVPHAASDSKMPWTDLSGRPLATSPATKGIYIRGGRKVMVK